MEPPIPPLLFALLLLIGMLLLLELGRRHTVGGQEDSILDVAAELAEKRQRSIDNAVNTSVI